MRRARGLSIALSAALVMGVVALPATAKAPKPPKPFTVIEDPLGDANFINDQGTGDGSVGDQTAADAGTVSDIIEIIFSNDAQNLFVDIKTEAAPPAASGVGFRIRVNPEGTGGAYCVFIEAFFQGANNNLTAPEAQLRDDCGGGDTVPLEVLGTRVVVPRESLEAFAKGATLAAPQAQSFLYSGTSQPAGVIGPFVDTTLVGTDYKMVDKKK